MNMMSWTTPRKRRSSSAASLECSEAIERYDEVGRQIGELNVAGKEANESVQKLKEGLGRMEKAYTCIANQLGLNIGNQDESIQKLAELSHWFDAIGDKLDKCFKEFDENAVTYIEPRLESAKESLLSGEIEENNEGARLVVRNLVKKYVFENAFNKVTGELHDLFENSAAILNGVRQIDFSDTILGDLTVFATTFNAGEKLPEDTDIEQWLPLPQIEGHDLIVISMQEAAVKDNVAASDGSADPMESKLMSHLRKLDFHPLEETLISNVYKGCMIPVRSIRLHIFSRESFRYRIQGVQVKAINTGFNFNKGAVVCRLNIDDSTPLAFISSHLPAHEGDNFLEKRNADVKTIMQEVKKICGLELGLEASAHHVFWLGDLNYRIHPHRKMPSETFRNDVLDIIEKHNYNELLDFDELTVETGAGRVFHGYSTPKPNFPPTYKLERGVKQEYENKKMRIPSYTDRILIHSLPGTTITNNSYEAVFDVTSSDHKPVRGTYTIKGRKVKAQRGECYPGQQPTVIFNSIEIDRLDIDRLSHRGSDKHISITVYADPWLTHESNCRTEKRPMAKTIQFDFRSAGASCLKGNIPFETFEGTHLILCLEDSSADTSKTSLGHAVLSMDDIWARQNFGPNDASWDVPIVAEGVVIGNMKVMLWIEHWGKCLPKQEKRAIELYKMMDADPHNPEKKKWEEELRNLKEGARQPNPGKIHAAEAAVAQSDFEDQEMLSPQNDSDFADFESLPPPPPSSQSQSQSSVPLEKLISYPPDTSAESTSANPSPLESTSRSVGDCFQSSGNIPSSLRPSAIQCPPSGYSSNEASPVHERVGSPTSNVAMSPTAAGSVTPDNSYRANAPNVISQMDRFVQSPANKKSENPGLKTSLDNL